MIGNMPRGIGQTAFFVEQLVMVARADEAQCRLGSVLGDLMASRREVGLRRLDF